MEEYTQITLDEWTSWKEDIRRKLAETAGNFVYIGYRLKQIRDSGMYDGCEDIFEFAKKEYGLGKSTVSRFIAINEKFSKNGNSIELKDEYQAIGSSKLAEMLTLPDAECALITERTTVKEIRDLKSMGWEDLQEAQNEEMTPLQKCIWDMFSDQKRKDALNAALKAETQEEIMAAVEEVNPGGYATHKKGLVFLFMYGSERGVSYKEVTKPMPVNLTWVEFVGEIKKTFWKYSAMKGVTDYWRAFFGDEKQTEAAERPNEEDSVATSQQKEKKPEKEVKKTDQKPQKEGKEQAESNPEPEETENVTEEAENTTEEPEKEYETEPESEMGKVIDGITQQAFKKITESTEETEETEEDDMAAGGENADEEVQELLEDIRFRANQIARELKESDRKDIATFKVIKVKLHRLDDMLTEIIQKADMGKEEEDE